MYGMPSVCGLFDGSLMGIKSPSNDEQQFVDRHGNHSLNVMPSRISHTNGKTSCKLRRVQSDSGFSYCHGSFGAAFFGIWAAGSILPQHHKFWSRFSSHAHIASPIKWTSCPNRQKIEPRWWSYVTRLQRIWITEAKCVRFANDQNWLCDVFFIIFYPLYLNLIVVSIFVFSFYFILFLL